MTARNNAPHIVLREWRDADAGWYVDVRDEEIFRFSTERPDLAVDELLTAMRRLRADGNRLGFVAVEAESGERLANLAASLDGELAEVSYWVAPAARGKGVATQALRALCERIDATWQVAEIRLHTHRENHGSRQVAVNAGFRLLSEDQTHEVDGGQWPVAWYSRPAGPRTVVDR